MSACILSSAPRKHVDQSYSSMMNSFFISPDLPHVLHLLNNKYKLKATQQGRGNICVALELGTFNEKIEVGKTSCETNTSRVNTEPIPKRFSIHHVHAQGSCASCLTFIRRFDPNNAPCSQHACAKTTPNHRTTRHGSSTEERRWSFLPKEPTGVEQTNGEGPHPSVRPLGKSNTY